MVLQIPPEIIFPILSRLPVKSLLRFKSVSKQFCTEIDSHDFINLHLALSLEANTNLSIVVKNFDSRKIISFDLATLKNKGVRQFPIVSFEKKVTILGACNGFLCVVTSQGTIVLLNMATRKQHLLIHCDQLKESRLIGGFVYDPASDDYKVVVILTDNSSVMLYSSKAKAWRKLTKSLVYTRSKNGVLFCNNLHFAAETTGGVTVIAALDVHEESMKEVALPNSMANRQDFRISLGVLVGCLCMLPVCGLGGNYFRGDVWVMKEYGMKESWAKLFSFLPDDISLLPNRALDFFHGLLVGVDPDEGLFYYDLKKKKKMKKIQRGADMGQFSNFRVQTVVVDSLLDFQQVIV